MFKKTISDWVGFKTFLCVPGAPCAKPKVEHIFFTSTAYRYIGGYFIKKAIWYKYKFKKGSDESNMYLAPTSNRSTFFKYQIR